MRRTVVSLCVLLTNTYNNFNAPLLLYKPGTRSVGNVVHWNDEQRRRNGRNALLLGKKNNLYINQLCTRGICSWKKNIIKVNKLPFKRMASIATVDKSQGDLLEELKKNLVIGENPAFIQERLAKYNELKEKKRIEREELLKSDPKFTRSINVQLLDGSVKVGQCNVTTPFHIATSISKRLAEDSIVARVTYVEKVELELCDIEEELEEQDEVNETKDETLGCKGQLADEKPLLWDMNVPLLGSCKIEFLNLENEEAKKTFWHSSAHILGSSLEKLFGGYLTIGPPLKEGFYYDIYLGDFSITNEDYKKIEEEFNKLIKQNAEFEKLICTKDEVMELFQYNPFKLELIKSKIPENKKTSVYKCGNFIDLCLGPHIKSTGKAKAFKVLKNSAAYWLGNKNNDSLQRIYGITFQKKTELNDYLNFLEEAKKRDHRNVGKKLHFFFFDKDTSPGSCFWLPHGAKIYNKLVDFIRREYRIRMYDEVITPNVFSCDLWRTSGHYQNYKDCMFIFNVEQKEWGMKPMNCPGHCIMFKQLNASYRSLPIRLADFGVLHRNEISGSLSGLTRVRRFQQDDSHIFCTFDQIKEEVLNTLHFIFFIYDLFGFKYELFLSTRPKKFIGNISTWDFAEQGLKDALNSANISWKINEGDGAFYGPKIDILLRDSINRTHQCGTIQLDFQLPCRFNLQYKNKDFGALNEGDNAESGTMKREEVAEKGEGNQPSQNKGSDTNLPTDTAEQLKKGFDRPVIIHRAILGSVERFVAILIEHTAGKLPFWISPRQAIVLPVSDKFNDYANYVYQTLNNHFFDVEIDTSLNTLNKKIREAQLNQFNFILVVGEKELTTNTVTVRNRDDQNNHEVCSLEELIARFRKLLDVNSMPFNQIKPFNQVKPPQ
ncbi:threonine--tRNA ligase, putative [Plasmodium knowlesi strain H]|uniref:threonine--tRNA ligase n=3 Tax=Plasmodium knowlesi TaxID=5850 RepID=A0A5K1UE66_PLAKH|nr:threonine--tRNA ligase, putative [Plasmodium knowlesi strain H]OTN65168.1 putative Threonine--tRNA ligase [Plasmodium knowlesi]CAA9988286.1 threonine--tRNA ligase, putative [Plasmodium knowlesi strain H]SBO20227.1 threonine--tRNA ligase, putative [Plasmodium knowlesi strain H]SBO20349.1 threonine--tRNA ligase, putative [Plasmodium knowlesi strain H]VVS77760.1 threonine--tRNA ligase, putative [Plasmodium knowlesi strain H]|eukprot:XP_002259263.1 threonine--trna ligase, putative [Plasmodium knowlesi strain H]